MNNSPAFITKPRLAKSKLTGGPVTSTPEERTARRARAALVTAEAATAIDTHRARLERPAANDNADPRWRGNLPVLHNITKDDPEGAYAVWAFGQQSVLGDVHGDVNALFDGEDEPEELHEFQRERVHKIRPSIEEMFSDLLRVRVVHKRGPQGWEQTYRHSTDVRVLSEGAIGLGGMQFNMHRKARRPPAGGLMTSYVDRNGVTRQPFYDTSETRGADEPLSLHRRPTSAHALVAPAAEPIPLSEAAAGVLEMILAGFHKYEIGEARGYSRDYADRGAQRHINQAVAEAKSKFPAPARLADNDDVNICKAAA
ncbi:hypothetical protein NKI61_23190 [Mesorhizobium sp. M0514]|uniref:hypothetical protein n=1 Tax=Mesorhizobium sp. M0514 TaxID=2956955 RepID=UPI0033361EFF